MKIKWYNKIGLLEIMLLGMAGYAAYLTITLLPENKEEAPVELTFEQTVEQWSKELSESIAPVKITDDIEGNCLPVAMELQRRIVDTGRIAFIAVTHPENLETGHALVVYSSEIKGRLDSVIDNGFSTYNKVVPKDFLDTGVFGKYTGTCEDPDPSKATCGNIGLAW